MLSEIFEIDRRLRIDYKRVLASPFYNKDIIHKIDNFLVDYMTFYNLSIKDILFHYYNFVKRYSENVKVFSSTNKYPRQLGVKIDVDRNEYDISLILSTAVTIHRHRIFKLIHQLGGEVFGKTLIVGVGSGLELDFLTCRNALIDAYDINISNFVKDRFSDINLKESKFAGREEYYDNIFALELLEHLSDPYEFISCCFDSLRKGGKFYLTTATNVPQFDHLYNFKSNNEFESKVNGLGFKINENEDILHDYLNKNMYSKNTWYILEKE